MSILHYPDELLEEIRQRNDIVDVISSYVQLKKQGGNYFGLCPFHNEKSPSFSVSGYKQMYFCFGCHAGGSVYTFIQQYENVTFPEAVQILADRAGIQLPEVEYSAQEKEMQNRKQKLLEANTEAGRYFFYQLRREQGKLGWEYLMKRELTEETCRSFGLGYSLQYSDDLVKYLRHKGFTDDIIRESGLGMFYEREGMVDKFINRVMFPIMDINGKVIAFGGRVMGDAKPKYLNSPESQIFDKSRNLYGLNFARRSRKDQFILCEGYMDVIAQHQAGFTQAVASLGTSFTSGQAAILKRYAKDVLLAYDSDNAGTAAALRALGILREAGLNGRVIDLKPYKDPDEFIKNLGAEEYQKRLDQAENGFMFEVRMAQKKYRMDDPTEKTKFYTEIARMLCRFETDIERDTYLSAVSEEYRIQEDSLKKLVIAHANSAGFAREREKRESGEYFGGRDKSAQKAADSEEREKRSQRLLLTWLVEEPGLYTKIKKYIAPGDFTDELYQKVAERIFEDLEEQKVNPAAVINMFEDMEDQRRVSELFSARLDAIDTPEEKEKALHDIVVNVKKQGFERDSAKVGSDPEALARMIAGKKALEELSKTKLT